MTTAKPIAALSAGLLARKGEARPAMRRQGFGSLVGLSDVEDDLGWNDLGDPTPEPPLPPVLRERAALAEEIAAQAPVPVSVATAARLQSSMVRTGRAAFTLRLDRERHLKLKLASATRGRSAQYLVTAALDAFLDTLPEVEALVAQLPPHQNTAQPISGRSKD
ncbi:hypothetical protein [Sphingomonas radiodurans]|uniref:hypothetical protein n=1 Tax=Sphingomonas radiodurans TaxID=2890321 RepID=UPI001E327D2C|nr:hypothetical protein [Sphingomonas radiodurans]WBH16884.1 hypothetical protein LLW23_01825 [Sphingomonas radiodurans]